MHRFINSKIIVVKLGLVCLMVIQAEAESVPAIAQEFTKLFTVAALEIPQTSPNLTKC